MPDPATILDKHRDFFGPGTSAQWFLVAGVPRSTEYQIFFYPATVEALSILIDRIQTAMLLFEEHDLLGIIDWEPASDLAKFFDASLVAENGMYDNSLQPRDVSNYILGADKYYNLLPREEIAHLRLGEPNTPDEPPLWVFNGPNKDVVCQAHFTEPIVETEAISLKDLRQYRETVRGTR